MIRLSIIIPFYNVERYIAQCLDSVYQQDIPEEEYEVICVNDCSPDNSREVVLDYQKKHTNLRLIEHERNKKLGGARNTGLRAAKGRYIWFIDSDDYLSENTIGRLLQKAEDDELEYLLFHFCMVINNKRTIVRYPSFGNEVLGGEQLLQQAGENWSICFPTAWNKLYLREFLIQNNLYFVEDLMYEDTDWSFGLLRNVQRGGYINVCAYNYRENAQSITGVHLTAEKVVYTILQQSRCASVAKQEGRGVIAEVISKYVKAQLTALRKWIKALDNHQKNAYRRQIRKYDISVLRPYSTWRTWLAIRYGITWFVKD